MTVPPNMPPTGSSPSPSPNPPTPAAPGTVGTSASGASAPAGGAAARDPNDPTEVLVRTQEAALQVMQQLVTEVRLSGIRAAAAAGSKEDKNQLENLLPSGIGGGLGPMAGIDTETGLPLGMTTAATTATATGDPGATAASSRNLHDHSTTLSQVRSKTAKNIGQAIQDSGDGIVRQRIGATVKESGGTLGGLGQSIRQNIPFVGPAFDVIDATKGLAYNIQNQFVAGRQYEQIEGPMSAMSQQKERFRAWEYANVTGFGIGNKEAAAEFAAATQAGYTGQGRSQVLQQMYHLTTSTGMSAEEQQGLLEDVVKNANSSLGQLTDAIVGVSNAAKDSGVNAEVARQKFEDSFQRMTELGFGASAGNIAAGLSTSIVSMGKSMQGTSVSLGETDIYRYAGQTGMTPSQFLESNVQTGGATMAKAYDANAKMMIQGVLGPAYAQIQQMIAQAPGGAEGVRQMPSVATSIAQNVIGLIPNVMMLPQFCSQNMGFQNGDPMQCLTFIVQFMAGNTPGSNIMHQIRSYNPTGLTPGAKSKTGSTGLIDFGSNMKTYLNSADGSMEKNSALSSMIGKAGDLNQHSSLTSMWADHTNQTAQSVLRHEMAAGKRDPIIEGMMQQVTNLDNQLMVVQTKKGPQVVTARRAMEEFPDQIRSGLATFYAEGKIDGDKVKVTGRSQYAGEGTQQILGYADTRAATQRKATQEGKDTAPAHGISKDEADTQLKDKDPKDGSTLTTFDLTPAARAVLMPLVNGSASQVGTAAAYGTPPANTYADSASSPGRQ